MAEEKTYEIPFTVLCLATYKSHLDIPESVVCNKDRSVLVNYIKEHLPEACVESDLEFLHDAEEDAVTLEDIRSCIVDDQIAQENHLKEAVIKAGVPAIEAFIEHELESTSDAYIEALMDDVIKQMPDDTYAKYVKYYLDEEVVS